MKISSMSIFAALLASVFIFSGCAGFSANPTPQGVALGGIVGDVNYPNYVGSMTKFELDSDDFTILQTVSAQASTRNILGMFSGGDGGYAALFEQARSVGGDDVINIKIDTRKKRFLGALYTQTTSTLTGVAIKYKK